jgi:hypothetical protein
MLALTLGVLTAAEPRIFLIDEPQAYLHPHAERSLLALFERYPQHQYIIATHSPLLLNSRPLDQSRLVTMEGGQTLVVEPTAADELLDEIGIRAADLWLADQILWVEGPSDVGAFEALMERELSPSERATTSVREMPDSSRFSARSSKQAAATYRFCPSVISAVSPLPVAIRFLFDRDEKTPEVISAIRESSGNRALVLPVRELENSSSGRISSRLSFEPGARIWSLRRPRRERSRPGFTSWLRTSRTPSYTPRRHPVRRVASPRYVVLDCSISCITSSVAASTERRQTAGH